MKFIIFLLLKILSLLHKTETIRCLMGAENKNLSGSYNLKAFLHLFVFLSSFYSLLLLQILLRTSLRFQSHVSRSRGWVQ